MQFEEEVDVTITFDSKPRVEVAATALGSMAKQVLGGNVLRLWQTGNLSDHIDSRNGIRAMYSIDSNAVLIKMEDIPLVRAVVAPQASFSLSCFIDGAIQK